MMADILVAHKAAVQLCSWFWRQSILPKSDRELPAASLDLTFSERQTGVQRLPSLAPGDPTHADSDQVVVGPATTRRTYVVCPMESDRIPCVAPSGAARPTAHRGPELTLTPLSDWKRCKHAQLLGSVHHPRQLAEFTIQDTKRSSRRPGCRSRLYLMAMPSARWVELVLSAQTIIALRGWHKPGLAPGVLAWQADQLRTPNTRLPSLIARR